LRALMVEHMTEAPKHVKRMKGKLRGRLILDSEIRKRVRMITGISSADEKDE
jgi:hypothetical protein